MSHSFWPHKYYKNKSWLCIKLPGKWILPIGSVFVCHNLKSPYAVSDIYLRILLKDTNKPVDFSRISPMGRPNLIQRTVIAFSHHLLHSLGSPLPLMSNLESSATLFPRPYLTLVFFFLVTLNYVEVIFCVWSINLRLTNATYYTFYQLTFWWYFIKI